MRQPMRFSFKHSIPHLKPDSLQSTKYPTLHPAMLYTTQTFKTLKVQGLVIERFMFAVFRIFRLTLRPSLKLLTASSVTD